LLVRQRSIKVRAPFFTLQILDVENPELLAASALLPVMDENEAIIVTGAERFTLTQGYGRTTTFWKDYHFNPAEYAKGKAEDAFITIKEGTETKRIIKRSFIAIDALPISAFLDDHEKKDEWSRVAFQLQKKIIDRELRKAFVGFSFGEAPGGAAASATSSSGAGGAGSAAGDKTFESQHFTRIATGKWGCGVFLGNDHVKALIQWIAASAAGRPMDFFCFESVTPPASSSSAVVPLSAELKRASEIALKEGVDSRHLYQALCEYGEDFRKSKQERGVSIIRAVVARAIKIAQAASSARKGSAAGGAGAGSGSAASEEDF
jgi:Poly (ADP-ribose) glycohydrolase (PARG)